MRLTCRVQSGFPFSHRGQISHSVPLRIASKILGIVSMKHKVCARERVFEHLPTVSSSLFPFGGYCCGEKLHPSVEFSGARFLIAMRSAPSGPWMAGCCRVSGAGAWFRVGFRL